MSLIDSSGKPVATMKYVICTKGHVNEAPAHGAVVFRENDGSFTQVVLCGRCQFEFHRDHFGGLLLPDGTSRREAEWKAKEIAETTCGMCGTKNEADSKVCSNCGEGFEKVSQ